MSDELGNYKIQLEQVEVALAAEPNNKDLLKLKEDLQELIRLQQEVDESTGKQPEPSSRKAPRFDEPNHKWKVGDRCMAKNKNGNKQVATIDGISQDKVAITFNNGTKDVVRISDLHVAPVVERKTYVFESNSSNKGDAKKDWKNEKERRKIRAQKKEQRRKQIEEEQEKEKKSWKSFNQKAINKNFKGIKKISVTASSADGPRGGIQKPSAANISSRSANSFGYTSRGNMDSLF
uniref:Tudor domain-containing protein n=1 Tax=Panagrolaimus sp. JU765 TaxID=591449 RepID=A0AC34RCI8_9BILA